MICFLALLLLALAGLTYADPSSSVLNGPAEVQQCDLAHFEWGGLATPSGPISFTIDSSAGPFVIELAAGAIVFDWVVNYTSGTTIRVSVTDSSVSLSPAQFLKVALTKAVPYTQGALNASSIFYEVQPGSSASCLTPGLLNPTFTASAPAALVQCEDTGTFSWQGGTGPYSFSIFSDLGVVGVGPSRAPQVFGTNVIGNSTSFDWIVNYSAGTSLSFLVQDFNSAVSPPPFAYLPSMLVQPGFSSSCLAAVSATQSASASASSSHRGAGNSTSTQPSSTATPGSQSGQDENDSADGSYALSSSQIAALAGGSVGSFILGILATLFIFLLARRSRSSSQSGPIYDLEADMSNSNGLGHGKGMLGSLDLPTPTFNGTFPHVTIPPPATTTEPEPRQPSFSRTMSARAREAFRLSGANPLVPPPAPAAFLPMTTTRPSMSYSHLALTPNSSEDISRTPTPLGGASYLFSGSGGDSAQRLLPRKRVPSPSPSVVEPEPSIVPVTVESEDEESEETEPPYLEDVEEEDETEEGTQSEGEGELCSEEGCGLRH
ncbi:hypothetical protein RQP46_005957 [Phenoliferia psychrophenolica]